VHTRQRVCRDMQYLNIHLDEEKNKISSTAVREINSAASPVKILVVPTDEELEIAKQCFELLGGNK